MSLYMNLLHEAGDLVGSTAKSVKVWDWVRSKMDFVKFRNRAAYSRWEQNQTTEVKNVLMEYSSTWRRENQTTHFYVPGTGINTNCLQYDNKVIDYLHYQIANRDPSVVVYSRRKIVDGVPHPFLRQLVVKMNVYVPEPPLPEDDPPSPIESLDSDDDYIEMPPLVSSHVTS
jgi:hypothetical protein